MHPTTPLDARSLLLFILAPASPSSPVVHTPHHHQSPKRLVARPSRLRNHLGHLVDLPLRAAERAEPLLGQLARALVLGVAEQFDHAAFVGGEAVEVEC